MAGLTDKQERFIAEYLVDLNATQAAIRAGYSKRAAYAIGAENLRKPQIQEKLSQRQRELARKVEITQECVLAELKAVGFANSQDYFEWDDTNGVTVKPSAQLSREQLAAVMQVKQREVVLRSSESGEQLVRRDLDFKFHPKIAALTRLGEHLGLFKMQVQVSTPDGGPLMIEISDEQAALNERILNTDYNGFLREIFAAQQNNENGENKGNGG